MRNYILPAAAAAILFTASIATGMEFRIHQNHSDRLNAILAEGEIVPGDTSRLKETFNQLPRKQNDVLYLSSLGGSLYEGMSLGRFAWENGIKTVVEGGEDCASACALAFLGGRDHDGNAWRSSSDNSRLGFHAFRSIGSVYQDENDTQRVVADVLEYTRSVHAPIELIIKKFATPSHSVYWLSNAEICLLGIKLWSNAQSKFVCQ